MLRRTWCVGRLRCAGMETLDFEQVLVKARTYKQARQRGAAEGWTVFYARKPRRRLYRWREKGAA